MSVAQGNEIEPLLTVDQVAVILGVTIGTVRQWVKHGRLPVVEVAYKTIRFDPAELAAWIEARKRPAKAAA